MNKTTKETLIRGAKNRIDQLHQNRTTPVSRKEYHDFIEYHISHVYDQAHTAGRQEESKQWVNDIIDAFGSLVPVSGVEANNPEALAETVEELLVEKGRQEALEGVLEWVEGKRKNVNCYTDHNGEKCPKEAYNQALTDIKNHLT